MSYYTINRPVTATAAADSLQQFHKICQKFSNGGDKRYNFNEIKFAKTLP
jgi:hypothetical protein